MDYQISRRNIINELRTTDVDSIKTHLRITHDTHDDYLEKLGLLAEDLVTDLTNAQLKYSEVILYFNNLIMDVPIYPVIEVISLSYYDLDEGWIEIASSAYDIISYGTRKRIAINNVPPITNLITTVRYQYRLVVRAGFTGTITDSRLEMAVLLLVAHWYHNNLPVVPATMRNLPYGLQNFLMNLKGIELHEVS